MGKRRNRGWHLVSSLRNLLEDSGDVIRAEDAKQVVGLGRKMISMIECGVSDIKTSKWRCKLDSQIKETEAQKRG